MLWAGAAYVEGPGRAALTGQTPVPHLWTGRKIEMGMFRVNVVDAGRNGYCHSKRPIDWHRVNRVLDKILIITLMVLILETGVALGLMMMRARYRVILEQHFSTYEIRKQGTEGPFRVPRIFLRPLPFFPELDWSMVKEGDIVL
jgi:hypothetical protein